MTRQRNPARRDWMVEHGGYMVVRLEMLVSPAWQAAPAPLLRLLDRLHIEHLRHGGRENGWLRVDYSSFEEHRVSRRQISALLDLAERLGLIEVGRGKVASNGVVRPPNVYRLTYFAEKGHRAPTDEWSFITVDQAEKAVEAYREADKAGRRAKTKPERVTANAA